MKIYLVGGAVRDQLMGRTVKDRDWVVIGATVEEMIAQGFKQVGKDFPVFLHPKTHEEYALARTERKNGHGYSGFVFFTSPKISLEEDLLRRDLTINAIAMDSHGEIIDPYGGVEDIQAGILRHVSQAFIEDPVRILRVARFASRYEFQVAKETMQLMQYMVENGEVSALVSERVWQEIAKGLQEQKPSLMLQVLYQCGALQVILPEIQAVFSTNKQRAYLSTQLDTIAQQHLPLIACYGVLTINLNLDQIQSINRRLNVPREVDRFSKMLNRHHQTLLAVGHLSSGQIVETLQLCDMFRQPDRFLLAVQVVSIIYHQPNIIVQWQNIIDACCQMNVSAIAQSCKQKSDIPMAIRQARVGAVQSIIE